MKKIAFANPDFILIFDKRTFFANLFLSFNFFSKSLFSSHENEQ